MNDEVATIADRFMSYVSPEPNSGCWLWTGAATAGYGAFWAAPKMVKAHRFSYELHCGAIPEGKTIDHLCRVRFCVNPQHLEAVTRGENVRRSTAWLYQRNKTHCPSGHAYSPENTHRRGRRRYCIACRRVRDAQRIRRTA